jgi:hypothetical protein
MNALEWVGGTTLAIIGIAAALVVGTWLYELGVLLGSAIEDYESGRRRGR